MVLPQDVERDWDDLIWSWKEDHKAASKEFWKWRKAVRSRWGQIDKLIKKELNEERKKLLREVNRKLAAERLELVLMEQEEKRQAAIKAFYEESQRQAKAHTEKLRAAMQASLKKMAEAQQVG